MDESVETQRRGQEPRAGSSRSQGACLSRSTGFVTLLNRDGGFGLIDSKILFTTENLRQKKDVKKGDAVTYVPKRGPSGRVEAAEDVALLDKNDDKTFGLHKVVKIEEDWVWTVTDGSGPMKVGKQYLQGMTIHEGDWLRLEFSRENASQGEPGQLIRVEWPEIFILDGKVVSEDTIACGNELVSFTDEVVEATGGPGGIRMISTNDPVVVMAIASDQSLEETGGRSRYRFRKRALVVRLDENKLRNEVEPPSAPASNQPILKKLQSLNEERKNRITIRPVDEISFGSVRLGDTKHVEVIIENHNSKPIVLKSVKVVQEGRDFSCNSEANVEIWPRVLHRITMTCKANRMGRTEVFCVFDFGSKGQMLRPLKVTVVCEEEPWQRPTARLGQRWRQKREEREQLRSEMFEDSQRVPYAAPSLFHPPLYHEFRLHHFRVPPHIYEVFCKVDYEAELLRMYDSIDFDELNRDNYETRLHLGLWLEELENESTRKNYDLKQVPMFRHEEFLVVAVPLLDEMIPSVQTGDQVECISTAIAPEKFVGTIKKIRKCTGRDPQVYLSFNQIFLQAYPEGFPVDRIHFKLSRNSYRRQHFAVEKVVNRPGLDWLFPTRCVPKKPLQVFVDETVDEPSDFDPEISRNSAGNANQQSSTSSSSTGTGVDTPLRLGFFDRSLNKEQRNAVRSILHAVGRPLPYIIFGPPGTGKTVTVVEAVKQLYFHVPSAKILVCVPSNAGADLIAKRLAESQLFTPSDFVRLNGFLRSGRLDSAGVPDCVKPFCNDGDNLSALSKCRLIVCTVVTAGQFFQLNQKIDGFSHVFIDEAGYCTEPEALIPCVLGTADRDAVVVLAGDPHQLGPVVMNNAVVNNFMQTSFLERIMLNASVYKRNTALYTRLNYNPVLMTKLVKNYRSHPLLLQLPSTLFYHGELQACASEDINMFCRGDNSLPFMVKPNIPLIFHGVRGNCGHDWDSPSWYNNEEVRQVANYVVELKGFGLNCEEDIGIITPYRKQADRIKAALVGYLPDGDFPKVASVQEFQGGERKVIIISTVRSQYEPIPGGKTPNLEFLYSPKLFNVAITRAKALMIVVGNPDVHYSNKKCWGKLLQYCIEKGVYTGCNLPLELNQKLHKVIQELDETPDPSAGMDVDSEDWDTDRRRRRTGWSDSDSEDWLT